jgi:hypothetical protein
VAAAVVTTTEEVTEVGVTQEVTTADAAVEEEMATTIAAAMEAEVNIFYFFATILSTSELQCLDCILNFTTLLMMFLNLIY